ncbi:unnamed protein product [Linum trigynum]|uniref:Uncharacterized protein n=1 Tax=Linum trigynum TaxID=586398 RepID=A0AAV2GQV9_9ROSI
MDSEKTNVVSAKLDGKNFPILKFQFQSYVSDRRLLIILLGQSLLATTINPEKDQDDWAASNAQLVSWLLGLVDVATCLSLHHFAFDHEMWAHIGCLHSQNNASR